MPTVTVEGELGMGGEMQLAINMIEPFSTAKSEKGTVISTSDETGETREQLIQRLEKLGLNVVDK